MTRKDTFVLLVQTGVLVRLGPGNWTKALAVVARAALVDEAYVPEDVEAAASWLVRYGTLVLVTGSGHPRALELLADGREWYDEWLEWRGKVGLPALPW